MLSVILTILKILGISILVILGLIIVLLLLILFVPIRYKADGEYKDKKIDLSGCVTWLLHIVSVRVFYNNEKPLHIRVCLFGIPLFDNLRKKAKEEKRKKINEKKAKNDLEDTKTEIQAASEKDKEEEKFTKSDEDVAKNEKNDEVSLDDFTDNEKKSIIKKISEKIKNIADKIKYTFKKICDTISRIRDNIEYYTQLFQRERTKRAVEKIKHRLLCIFKNLKPKKFQINLHLGFDNPELMGKIMAVNGMLYPMHLGKIAILPEFEEKIIEGNFEIKGRISIYVYVWTAIVILLDKDIKLLIKRLKRN